MQAWLGSIGVNCLCTSAAGSRCCCAGMISCCTTSSSALQTGLLFHQHTLRVGRWAAADCRVQCAAASPEYHWNGTASGCAAVDCRLSFLAHCSTPVSCCTMQLIAWVLGSMLHGRNMAQQHGGRCSITAVGVQRADAISCRPSTAPALADADACLLLCCPSATTPSVSR